MKRSSTYYSTLRRKADAFLDKHPRLRTALNIAFILSLIIIALIGGRFLSSMALVALSFLFTAMICHAVSSILHGYEEQPLLKDFLEDIDNDSRIA